MKHIILNIEGMTCSACSYGLEKYLNKQDGVEASVNLIMSSASVNYDNSKITINDLERFVKEAGFKVVKETKDNNSKFNKYSLIFFAFIAISVMYISMGDMIGLPIPSIFNKMNNPKIYIITLIILSSLTIIWGFDIIKNGIKNLINKMPNMDSLIGIGVIVNFLFSLYNCIFSNEMIFDKIYFESVIMIILFVKLGRYIDKKSKARVVDVISNLVSLTPKNATILKDGKEEKVTINEVKKGDILVCKPGESVAVDGKITKGNSHTDESFLTGESKPVSKKEGDICLAGSINYEGYFEYEAINIGKNSSISHIVDLVVEATNTKAPIARVADHISRYFVPFIFIVSIISFILNYFITNSFSVSLEALVTVLVVACPCALGLATPLAIVVSIGTCSSKGLVIKRSEILEALNKIDTLVFDKTGTLTKGKLEISDYSIDKKYTKKEALKILQSIESKSNHPLALSICKNAKDLYNVSKFKEHAGKGIEASIDHINYYAGNRKYLNTFKIENKFLNDEIEFTNKAQSICYLWNDKEVIAIFGLRDEIKDGIKDTLKSLKELGKEVVMLSGDNEVTSNVIATELNIDKVYSNINPEGKKDVIKSLNTHDNVLMVGDGINDSIALKTASIGVSVSNGTDISNDAADVIMLSSDMNSLIDLFNIGKKTMRIIKENLFWALFYNVCMIPLASCLLPIKLNPMIASLAMVISSITVILNSLRLKK